MAEPVHPRRDVSRLLRIALFVSLALNFAVLGLVAGQVWSGRDEGRGRDGGGAMSMGLGPVASALDPEERRSLGADLRRLSGDARGGRRQNAQALLAALRQEPFDPEAMLSVMRAQRARDQQMQDAAQEIFVARLAAMTPERRAAFAARLSEDLRRGPPPQPRQGN